MSAQFIDWFGLAAKAQGVPDGWRWFQSEVKGSGEHSAFLLKGGIPTLYKSGPNKGKPNPKRYDQKRELLITKQELSAVRAAWEAETGKCSDCYGTGQQWIGSANGQDRYRDCKTCGATGKAAQR